MPTRRVAIGEAYLPTSGPAYGAVLLGAVVAEHLPELDPEQAELLPRLLQEARDGLSVPRLALRFRLQTDTHGLDRSRHRIVSEHGLLKLELDRHARPDPQILGAVMAAATLPPSARAISFQAIDAALRNPGGLPEGLEVRRLLLGIPGAAPPLPGASSARGGWDAGNDWAGVAADHRWAMEVLGVRAGTDLDRADVQARFRRLVRLAHPDHGAAGKGAADRMAELAEARTVLLSVIASTAAAGSEPLRATDVGREESAG